MIKRSPPPTVRIISPKPGERLKKKVIEVVIEAYGNSEQIDDVKLIHNGKRILSDNGYGRGKSKRDKNSITRTFKLSLVEGKNSLTASAYSKTRIESLSEDLEITLLGGEKAPVTYILAVGIDRYPDSKLDLNYAEADAQGFSDFVFEKLQKTQYVEIFELYNEEATRANIMHDLDEIAKVVQPEDLFILYYAGRGTVAGGKYFFVTAENYNMSSSQILTKNAISVEMLQRKLQKIKALKQVLIVDACQTEVAEKRFALRGAIEEKSLANLSRNAGVHIIASSGSKQFATEFSKLGHGLFTAALLEGLQGKADQQDSESNITLFELKSFLKERIPELTDQYSGEMRYPFMFSRGADFPLIFK